MIIESERDGDSEVQLDLFPVEICVLQSKELKRSFAKLKGLQHKKEVIS